MLLLFDYAERKWVFNVMFAIIIYILLLQAIDYNKKHGTHFTNKMVGLKLMSLFVFKCIVYIVVPKPMIPQSLEYTILNLDFSEQNLRVRLLITVKKQLQFTYVKAVNFSLILVNGLDFKFLKFLQQKNNMMGNLVIFQNINCDRKVNLILPCVISSR